MEKIGITSVNELEVDWTKDPEFEFADDADAAMTLQALGDQLADARRQVEEIMRYIRAAVPAAKAAGMLPQHIINETGVARQTVYDMLAGK